MDQYLQFLSGQQCSTKQGGTGCPTHTDRKPRYRPTPYQLIGDVEGSGDSPAQANPFRQALARSQMKDDTESTKNERQMPTQGPHRTKTLSGL